MGNDLGITPSSVAKTRGRDECHGEYCGAAESVWPFFGYLEGNCGKERLGSDDATAPPVRSCPGHLSKRRGKVALIFET